MDFDIPRRPPSPSQNPSSRNPGDVAMRRDHHPDHRRDGPRVSSVAERFRSPSPRPARALPQDRHDRGRGKLDDHRPRPAVSDRARHPRDSPRGPLAHDDGPRDSRPPPSSPRPSGHGGRDRPTRARSPSPLASSSKRRRSRSPPPFPPSRPKRSRREERNRRRRAERALARKSGNSRPERDNSPHSLRSPSPPHYHEPRDRFSERVEGGDPHRPRWRSRSPVPPRPSSSRLDSEFRDRSRSPRTYPRRLSPVPPQFDPPRGDRPPRSPRDRKSRRSRKRNKHREDRAFPGLDSATGSNSIEVNMNRRAGFVPSGPSSRYPHGDSRHGQSPSHMTASSSFHGSPYSQSSPYNNRRRGSQNSLASFSPHHQYPQAPIGPQSQYSSHQSPPHAPTGPASLRGFSRSGFRGSFNNSPRGGPRGAGADPRGPNWNTVGSGRNSRPPSVHSGNTTPHHSGPQYASSTHSDVQAAPAPDDGDRSPKRPDDDVPMANVDSPNRNMPPDTAPTGPSNASKFSFAFKPTNKAPAAIPKPEISQKFSSALPKKEPLQQRSHSVDERDRELPRDTPREPASSRARAEARAEYHQHRQAPEPPRTRKVKRIEKYLKPKPQLPPHLASSESVFFRKPGNGSVVGSGTYGKVFKGVHVYTQRLVALKKIRMEGERDGFPVTAVREIKLLQSLKHTNIVNLQEVMVERNECYMVFEYLSHDVTGLLNHPSFTLNPAQKKHLAMQLFQGLDYLHKRGVLHRDIKAANILVSNDGVLKLADFGLARFYAKRHQYDYTNRVVTIWYRSPELLLGETQYAAAVDIWSAACVMIEIFTRHAIFPGDGGEISQLDKIYAILGTPTKTEWPAVVDMPWFELLRPGYRRPNVFAEKYRERVPPAAFDLLSSMFQFDPAKRPSAEEALRHPYFTTEEPAPRQAVELKDVEGEWHEFESKALRKEKEKKEKQEREARRAASAREESQREKDKKRPPTDEAQREVKRPHLEAHTSTIAQT